LATAGPRPGHDSGSRDEHRTHREPIDDPSAHRSSERDTNDRAEAISDAGSERGTVEDTDTDLRTSGFGPRDRVEDGEPLDSDLRGDVGRRLHAIGFAVAIAGAERSTATIHNARPIAVHDTGSFSFNNTGAITFDDAGAVSFGDA
jgi:hypothetical protein